MKTVKWHKVPEHGLQWEETLAAGDVEGAHHLWRYWWAYVVCSRVDAASVWDLGCGCGYGSRILAERPDALVVGVDWDDQAVNHAMGEYGDLPNLTFTKAWLDGRWSEGAASIARRDGPNVVVAFDLLERLRHREAFMEQLVEVLPAHGIFLFSATHRDRERCAEKPAAGYFGYDTRTLSSFVRRYFHDFSIHPFEAVPNAAPEYVEQSDAIIRRTHPTAGFGRDCVWCRGPRYN